MAMKKQLGIRMRMNFWRYADKKRIMETIYLLPEDYTLVKAYGYAKSRMNDLGMQQVDVSLMIGNEVLELFRVIQNGYQQLAIC